MFWVLYLENSVSDSNEGLALDSMAAYASTSTVLHIDTIVSVDLLKF